MEQTREQRHVDAMITRYPYLASCNSGELITGNRDRLDQLVSDMACSETVDILIECGVRTKGGRNSQARKYPGILKMVVADLFWDIGEYNVKQRIRHDAWQAATTL